MTPAQIEYAARELCKARGLDPDEESGYHECAPAARRTGGTLPRAWESYRDEIERFAQVGTAIAAALQHEEKPTRRKKRLDSAVG
jgi:hypothetical protein